VRNKSWTLLFPTIITGVLCAAPARANLVTLQLGAGSKMLGGSATFDFDYIEIIEPDCPQGQPPPCGKTSTSTRMGYALRLAPSFGYFITDQVALSGQIWVDYPFGDLYQGASWPGSTTRVGVDGGLLYTASLTGSYVYIGAQVGIGAENQKVVSTRFTVPAGFMIGITSEIAFDLGTRIFYEFQDYEPSVELYEESGKIGPTGKGLHIQIGYIGIQSFF